MRITTHWYYQSALAFILIVIAVQLYAEPPRYRIEVLGPLWTRGASAALDVNQAGQVVGYHPNEGIKAFLWSEAGGYENLGALGQYSRANGINDGEQVVGDSEGYPFIWDRKLGMRQLVIPDGRRGSARKINNNSVSVGYTYFGSRLDSALWDAEGNFLDLGAEGIAYGINAYNAVTGTNVVPCGAYRTWSGYVWFEGEYYDLGIPDGASATYAYAINDNFQVAGGLYVYPCSDITAVNQTRAAIFDQGKWRDIHTIEQFPRSVASAINNNGEVVGPLYESIGTNSGEVFIWLPKDQQMYSLRSYITNMPPESYLLNATAINDDGVIVGYGFFRLVCCVFAEQAFVLIPER